MNHIYPAVISIHGRRSLLQEETEVDGTAFDGAIPQTPPVRAPLNPTTTFDSSMALTVIVLLTALFFLGFFSVYVRRFASASENTPSSADTERRRATPLNRKRGLDRSAVESLPVQSYGGAAKHRMVEDCIICLSEFEERESVKVIPYCGHVFHPTCIDTWLASHVTCPLCRSGQLFKVVDEVCLDVTQDRDEIGGSEIDEGSTVDNSDTWRNGGSDQVMRACSCSNPTV